jgi:hypothetical protein
MADYFESEARLSEALIYKREYPKSSFRWLAKQFNVNKDRIHRRWNNIQASKSDRDSVNLKLNKYQDKALCWYLTRLWEIGVPLRHKNISAAANEILTVSCTELSPSLSVGEHWPNRWLKRHPEFKV